MGDGEYIDPTKRSQKELILKLVDEMEELKKKVDKYMDDDSKQIRDELHNLKIQMAVLHTKAAAVGAVSAIIFSAIVNYFIG